MSINTTHKKPISFSELNTRFDITAPSRNALADLWESFKNFIIGNNSVPNHIDGILETDRIHSRLYGYVLNKQTNLHPWIGGNTQIESSKMAQTLDEYTSSLEPSPTEAEFLERCAAKLHTASQISETAKQTESGAIIGVWNHIKKLEPEESLIICGAWKRHGVVYKITRKEDHFILTIINTGEDTNASRLASGETPDFSGGRYRHNGYKIKNFSLELLKYIFPTPSNLSQNCNDTLKKIDTICLDKLKGTIQLGRLHYPQQRGNCVLKSLTSWFLEECIEQFGPIRGRYVYERFRFYYSKNLCAEINHIDKEASPSYLMPIYHARSPQELDRAITMRKMACQQVLSTRKAKTQLFAQVSQSPIFIEIYTQLTCNGLNLQSAQEIEELNHLIKRIENIGIDPMEIVKLATQNKGLKTWKKFKQHIQDQIIAQHEMDKQLQQDPIFQEIYQELTRTGWKLQSVQEMKELSKLIKKTEENGKNPMEIIAIAAKWKGSKAWKKFNEGFPILLDLIDAKKITEKALNERACTYSLILSQIRY